MTITTDKQADTVAAERSIPWWRFAPAIVGIGLVWPGGRSVLSDYAVELVILAFVCAAVATRPGFKDMISSAPRSARFGAKLLIAAFLVTQFMADAGQTYPFSGWAMYTAAAPEFVVTYDFQGLTESGESVDFMPSATNRTLSTKMSHEHLRRQSERFYRAGLDTGDATLRSQASEVLNGTINDFVALHNNLSPDEQVTTVVVTRLTLTFDELAADSAERHEVLRLAVEPS